MSTSTAIYWAEGITALAAIVGAYLAYRSKKQEESSDMSKK